MGLVNVTVISFTEIKAQGDLHAPFSKRYISHCHNKQNGTVLANSWGNISLFKLRFCYYLKHEEKRGICPGKPH